MSLPFIYKYQPLYLKDFEMDNELFTLIKTLIEMNNLNLLFVGDSGCGKTSIINAIIREYYGNIGDLKNENTMFINNLKEQGISYYRSEARTFCQTSGTNNGKKKILVLDDLDTINEQSQQVFRNCIDKYNHNIHFIASCTNTQKVLDSLQSRVTIIKIKTLTNENLLHIINKISRAEGLQLTNESLDFLIKISNNSVRTLINYLEKLKLINLPIDIDLVIQTCTNISFADFTKYTELCKNQSNLVEAIHLFYSLYDKGYSVMDILDNYFLFIKTTTNINEEQKYKILPLICKYITIFNNIHEDEIELALFTNNIVSVLQ
tara:strand:+ start:4609 stop:5568 length:960 start_codon:yes stop_codon:yes gene_type:complete